MAHEILALQIVEVLLGEPTDDSVEIAVAFVKDVGQLLEVSQAFVGGCMQASEQGFMCVYVFCVRCICVWVLGEAKHEQASKQVSEHSCVGMCV